MDRVFRLIGEYRPQSPAEAADRAQMLSFMAANTGWLTRENSMAHVTASGWIVDRERRSALMAFHNIYNSWSWTGGHADGDSDLLAVALREAREETGIIAVPVLETPLSVESISVRSHVKRGAFVSSHIHMNVTFLLEADPAAELRVKPDENRGVMWIPFEEIDSKVTEDEMRPIYAKLIARAAAH